MIVILGGSLVALAALAFLWYLWKAEGSPGGANATALWRWVAVNEALLQAVTLLSAALRVVLSAQAVVGTAMVASLLLERHGVPLNNVAEVSILRSANPGPLRLTSLLLSSTSFLRTAKMPILLMFNLLLGVVASHFFSTLLVSDLEIALLVGDPQVTALGSDMDTGSQGLARMPVLGFPPAFTPFGEVTVPASSVEDEGGAWGDTGVVRRVFIPMAEGNRTGLRSYDGKGFVHSSRLVCVRPMITGGIQLGGAEDGEPTPQFLGTIDFQGTWQRNAALAFPGNCTALSCFADAAAFNCDLPVQAPGREDEMVSLCYPTRSSFLIDPFRDPKAEPVSGLSEVILVLKSNLDSDRIATFQHQTSTSYPSEADTEDEFTTWVFDGVSLSASLCFQQQTFDFADIHLWSDHAAVVPVARWVDARWETRDAARLYGTDSNTTRPMDASARGIYTVRDVKNLTKTPLTTVLSTSSLISPNPLYRPAANRSLTLHLSQSGGHCHPQTASLFASSLSATGRPALALQALATVLASTTLRSSLPQLTVSHDATISASVYALVPRNTRGIFAVAGVVLSNIGTLGGIALLFLLRTRHSKLGDTWRTVSQLVSDETQWVLDESTEYDDAAVAAMLGPNGRGEVRVARTFGEGARVQVVLAGASMAAELGAGKRNSMLDAAKRRSGLSHGSGP